MVGQRRGLLAYLKKTDLEGYRALIAKLRYQKIINQDRAEYFSALVLCKVKNDWYAGRCPETTEKQILKTRVCFFSSFGIFCRI